MVSVLLETMHSGLEWRDDISAIGTLDWNGGMISVLLALWTGMEGRYQCYWKPCTPDWNGGMISVLLALWTGMEGRYQCYWHSGLEWRDDISATGTLDWNGGTISVLLETMHSGLEWRDDTSATGNHALWTGMEG